MGVGSRQSDKDLELEEKWAVGGWRRGFHWHLLIILEGQVTLGDRCQHTHKYTHTRILSGTGPTIDPDLTQNYVPDDNMQITDESQRPQTCTCPQGREEGRPPQHSPACSHTSHGFACWDCCSLPSAWLIPICPSELPQHYLLWDSSYALSPRKLLHSPHHIVSSSPFPRVCLGHYPLPQNTSWAHCVPAPFPTPHTLSLGAQKTTGEKAREPAALHH